MPGQTADMPVLEPEQRRELIQAILSVYEGAVNYNEPLIIDGMIEGVEKFTTTPQEMDFLASGDQVKSRILQAFGVNPIIVGEIAGANRAQAIVAEESFCENTVNPLIELLSESLTAWAAEFFAEPLAAWIAPAVPHQAELDLQKWNAALRGGAVTVNEYRRNVLNLPDLPGGDEQAPSEMPNKLAALGRNGSRLV